LQIDDQEEPVERAIPQLPADDLEIAKEFYVNKLGFKVAFEATEDGRSGLLGLARGTIQLTVDSPMDGHGRNACVALEVYDADAYYEEVLGLILRGQSLTSRLPYPRSSWLCKIVNRMCADGQRKR
jgi:hypothetical protein